MQNIRRLLKLPLKQDMKIPVPMLRFLQDKKIVVPTPIQMQGMPVA